MLPAESYVAVQVVPTNAMKALLSPSTATEELNRFCK